MLSVFGGKITTFRKLSEQVLAKLKPYFPDLGDDWTAKAHLPGGDIANADFEQFLADLKRQYPWLSVSLARHYAPPLWHPCPRSRRRCKVGRRSWAMFRRGFL